MVVTTIMAPSVKRALRGTRRRPAGFLMCGSREIERCNQRTSALSFRQDNHAQSPTKLRTRRGNPAVTSRRAVVVHSTFGNALVAAFNIMSEGAGLPLSEDALVVASAASMANRWGTTGTLTRGMYLIPALYVGVVISDLITFGLGRALKQGFMPWLLKTMKKDKDGFGRALSIVNTWDVWIGAAQRFMIGFRGPLCLMAGLTGMSFMRFTLGASIGCLVTLPIQLFVGYLLRHNASPYFTTLALVATPNLIGHVVGPLMAWLGFRAAERMVTAIDQDDETSASQEE